MSSFVRGCKLVAVLAGVFFAGAVAADNPAQGYRSNTWFGTPDNYAEPWKESEAVLPDAPADENLTALISDRFADEYEYVIDRNSVSLQSDLVFRYTVVIRALPVSVTVFMKVSTARHGLTKRTVFLPRAVFKKL